MLYQAELHSDATRSRAPKRPRKSGGGKLYAVRHGAASRRAAFHGALEKLSPNVAVTVRCDISRLRRKSLSVFKPTQLFERVERHVTVRADRYSTVMSQIGTERKQAVTKICFGTRA